tara:strand:+ start:885 stop:1247 length:363 start_codon:yes stop_codon:yes gene_type:complete
VLKKIRKAENNIPSKFVLLMEYVSSKKSAGEIEIKSFRHKVNKGLMLPILQQYLKDKYVNKYEIIVAIIAPLAPKPRTLIFIILEGIKIIFNVKFIRIEITLIKAKTRSLSDAIKNETKG